MRHRERVLPGELWVLGDSVPCLKSETWGTRMFASGREQQSPPLRCGMTTRRAGKGEGSTRREDTSRSDSQAFTDGLKPILSLPPENVSHSELL